MSSGEKKFVIWLGVALVLWRLVQAIPVQDAFFRFVAMGIVPGARMALTPHQVYLVLASVFSLCLVVVFWKELRRSVTRQSLTHVTADVIVARQRTAAAQSDKAAALVVFEATAALSPATPPSPKMITIVRPKPAKATTTSLPPSRLAGRWAFPVLYLPLPRIHVAAVRQKTARCLRTLAIKVQRTAATIYKQCRRLTIITWKLTKILAKHSWCWAEPRIRRADRYIDETLHRNKRIAEALEAAEECSKGIAGLVRKLKLQ